MSTVLHPSALLAQDIEDAFACAACERVSDALVEMRCCGTSSLLCFVCIDRSRRTHNGTLASREYRRSEVACVYCKKNLGRVTYDDMVKVTPL